MPIFSLNEYQLAAARTIKPQDFRRTLDNGALGLAGEAGETVDHIKKYLHHDVPIDQEKLVKELGDVLWYVAELCTALGITLSEVANVNIEKLLARYPEKFTAGGGNRSDG